MNPSLSDLTFVLEGEVDTLETLRYTTETMHISSGDSNEIMVINGKQNISSSYKVEAGKWILRKLLTLYLGEATKKNDKKFHTLCEQ